MIRLTDSRQGSETGFALIEIIVALAIMALVGLMAWKGMDAMIRGREIIDQNANQDARYSQLVRQFERDCQQILRPDELSFLSNANTASLGNQVNNLTSLPTLVVGAKNIWWLRHYRTDNQDAWLLVGYGTSSQGLQRWTSSPLFRRTEAGSLWSRVMRDPDLNSSDLLVSLEMPQVVRQKITVHSSILNGAGGGGISATGTAASSTTINNTSAEAVRSIAPSQRGVTLQWWIKDISLPITRSCLMGGSL
jgi:general secretion pathway protein J